MRNVPVRINVSLFFLFCNVLNTHVHVVVTILFLIFFLCTCFFYIGCHTPTATQSIKRPARGASESSSIFWLFWVLPSWSEVYSVCVWIFCDHDHCHCYTYARVYIFLLRSLYPHLFSRAYINFKNPEDIIIFRDRFDGYVFIDNKGDSFDSF